MRYRFVLPLSGLFGTGLALVGLVTWRRRAGA